ncbi:hypothetical protein EWM64_g8750 [Hericium alpestre]|uniref:Uncharacterized protein n=1 Tax=Hericium alpestre TaxID=135208 RepID=A0A4Y9ZKJ9_9AGAM|nr:hypothetical protein EWM64_g8750 [Hericium alpestre]
MSTFEPHVVHTAIRRSLPPGERSKFDTDWDNSVTTRLKAWKKSSKHSDEACSDAQFDWAVNVVAYVTYLYSATKPPPLPQDAPEDAELPKPFALRAGVPLLGPLFVPPSYIHLEKRSNAPMIEPATAYLKPLHIVHPFYYPKLALCPRCGGDNVWCKDCQDLKEKQVTKEEKKKITYSCVTTNSLFWERWEYWQIPRGAPLFFHKCAVTRDLLDLILEVCLSSTSMGLAENIKQLHLLEYHQTVLDFLE